MPTVIGHTNAVDAATLSGGSWNATYPQANLKTRLLTQVARTTNADPASTVIILDLVSAKSIGCLGLIRTNLTAAATITLQANNANTWTGPLFDMIPFRVYASAADFLLPFTAVSYRYWRIIINDAANAAGYISVGRLFLGNVFSPAIPNDWNPSIQIESKTEVNMALGGNEFFDVRPNRRLWKFNWNWLSDAETYNTLIPMMRTNDISGEVICLTDTPALDPIPLIANGSDFANAYWTKSATTCTSNALLAPDGTLTGDVILETATTAQHYTTAKFGMIPAGSGGTWFTCTVYAKSINGRYFQIYMFSFTVANNYANFDLLTGVLGTASTGVIATITLGPNGWYRCTATVQATAVVAGQFGFAPITTASAAWVPSFAGDITCGIALWGATAQAVKTPLPLSRAYAASPSLANAWLAVTSDQSAAGWNKTGCTVTVNTTLAPDGNTTADSLIESAATTTHFCNRIGATIAIGQPLVIVYYAQAIGARFLQIISAANTGGAYANFDVVNGVLGTKFAGCDSYIEAAANGFWKCTMVVRSANWSNSASGACIALSNSSAYLPSYAGDGTSGLIVWGVESWASNMNYPVQDVIPDPTTRPLLGYLGRFRALDAVEHPYNDKHSIGIEIGELL